MHFQKEQKAPLASVSLHISWCPASGNAVHILSATGIALTVGTNDPQTSHFAKHFHSYSCICSSQQFLLCGVLGLNPDSVGYAAIVGRSHHNCGEPQILHLSG